MVLALTAKRLSRSPEGLLPHTVHGSRRSVVVTVPAFKFKLYVGYEDFAETVRKPIKPFEIAA
jgi:hypothetical protein